MLEAAVAPSSATPAVELHSRGGRGDANKIADVHPYAQMARNASLAIVVAPGGPQPASDGLSGDCGAAVQNILLTADLGYGRCGAASSEPTA